MKYKNPKLFLLAIALGSLLQADTANGTVTPKVNVIRVPDEGIQPQAVSDEKGNIHLIYYKGDPKSGNLFYRQSNDDGKTFTNAIRVNSIPGSAVAMGTIRGAHLSVGRNGRIHVAWNGSRLSLPEERRKDHGATPMLYSRTNAEGTAFETQRNLMTKTFGLDGGGSLAADAKGNVYVVWHGVEKGKAMREGKRAVWVTRSSNDGKSFQPESRANREATGACGCCGMRAAVDDDGRLMFFYRTAHQFINRDMHLLVSDNQAKTFNGLTVDRWRLGQCPMSSAFIQTTADGALLAWETDGQIYFQGTNTAKITMLGRKKVAKSRGKAKHPVLATDNRGITLVLWTEGTGWNRGGAISWEIFDKSGKPITRTSGSQNGVPIWSFAAAIAHKDGGFTILY